MAMNLTLEDVIPNIPSGQESEWIVTSSAVSPSGKIAISLSRNDPGLGPTVREIGISETGSYQKVASGVNNTGAIPVINDSKDFILAGGPDGKFVSYKAAQKVKKLEELLPEKYRQQFRFESPATAGQTAPTSVSSMLALANSGKLVFTMECLEGRGRGQWAPRTFISAPDPAQPATSNLRTLQQLQFPENYQVTLKGGPQGLTDQGLLAAEVTETKIMGSGGTYTDIPVAQRMKKPGLLPIAELTVDANRDGIIKLGKDYGGHNENEPLPDVTTKERPFRFWCNDDQDDKDTYDPDDGPGIANEETIPAQHKDSLDIEIKTKRDLEDFTRLHINIGGLQEAIAHGDIQVGLEWRNVEPVGGSKPSIKVYQAAEPDGGDEYIRNSDEQETWATRQINGQFDTALAGATIAADDKTFRFPSWFWESTYLGLEAFSATHPNRYLLFEGVSEGKGQLVLTFWKGSTPIGEGGSVWLDIKNIKKMYQRGYSVAGNNQTPYSYTGSSSPPSLDIVRAPDPNSAQAFEKALDETKQCVVFVHGFNTTYDGSTNTAETIFKRLW